MVRSDLSKSQQAVQSGHCVAEHLIKNKNTVWTNGTLVYLKVESEHILKTFLDIFKRGGFEFASFSEPDIGDQLTAISCLGHDNLFKSLKLL